MSPTVEGVQVMGRVGSLAYWFASSRVCHVFQPRILSQPPVFKRGIEVNRHVPYRDSTLTLLLLVHDSWVMMVDN